MKIQQQMKTNLNEIEGGIGLRQNEEKLNLIKFSEFHSGTIHSNPLNFLPFLNSKAEGKQTDAEVCLLPAFSLLC